MKSSKFKNQFTLRFEYGDDFVAVLERFALENNIFHATFQGLGSFQNCELGFYQLKTKQYQKKKFSDTHEVVNLTGNISLLENKPFLHCHVTLSDKNFNAFGGHLFSAKVGATLEISLEKNDKVLERKYNSEVGLNLLDLDL